MKQLKNYFLLCTNICIANLFSNDDTSSSKDVEVSTLEELNKRMIAKFDKLKRSSELEVKKIEAISFHSETISKNSIH